MYPQMREFIRVEHHKIILELHRRLVSGESVNIPQSWVRELVDYVKKLELENEKIKRQLHEIRVMNSG